MLIKEVYLKLSIIKQVKRDRIKFNIIYINILIKVKLLNVLIYKTA